MKNRDRKNTQFRNMVAIGESHCAGASATRRELGWAEVLRATINQFQDEEIVFFNAGIGADILSTKCPMYPIDYHNKRPIGIERYRKHLIEKKPDLAILAYGYNDLRGGTELADFIADYETMVSEIKAETGAVIVLVTPYYIPDRGFTHKNGGTCVGETWYRGTEKIYRDYVTVIQDLAARLDVLCADVARAQKGADWLVCDSENGTDIHLHDLGHHLTASTIFETLAANCSCLSQKALRIRGIVGKSPWRADPPNFELVLIRDFYPEYDT